MRRRCPSSKSRPDVLTRSSSRPKAPTTPLHQFQHHPQPFINSALQAWRQSPGLLGQETAIECHQLRHVDGRVARQAGHARTQQHVAWRISGVRIAGNHRHDDRLNAAAVERIGLDHKHPTPVTRLGAARLGVVRRPVPTRNPSQPNSTERDAIENPPSRAGANRHRSGAP